MHTFTNNNTEFNAISAFNSKGRYELETLPLTLRFRFSKTHRTLLFDAAVLHMVGKAPAKLSQHCNATLLGATSFARLATVLRHVLLAQI